MPAMAYTKFANYSPGLGEDGLPQLNDYATHNIDVGVDYSDSLTLAPRLTFDFGTGTALTTNSGGVGSVNQGTHIQCYRLCGAPEAVPAHLGRIAQLQPQCGVHRDLQFRGGIRRRERVDRRPLHDRLDGSASVSYVHGSPFSQGAAPLSSLTAGAQLRYAISTNAAAYASYTFGFFDQAYRSTLIPSSPLDFSPTRQGVRVGFSFWFDLLH